MRITSVGGSDLASGQDCHSFYNSRPFLGEITKKAKRAVGKSFLLFCVVYSTLIDLEDYAL